jgi:hypothetical protein
MPHITALGHSVEYAFRVLSKPMSKCTEKNKKFIDTYQRLFDVMIHLDNHIITLREENMRLKHENEFMLRLINERDNQ